MAIKIRDLFIAIGIKADEDAIKRIDKGLDQIKGTAELTATAIKGITVAVGAMTIATGFFLKQAGEFEQAQVAFETMLGSAEKAKDLLSDIQQFAAKTPFQFTELVGLSKRVLAFGFSMEEVIPTLSTLGNIASGVGKDALPRLLLALGQVRAAGRLRGQEVRQFTEAGVPLIEQLSKTLGVAQSEVQGLISAGKVSFEDTRDALNQLAGPGGRFFNLMIRQSKTLLGAVSNTIDILQILATEIGTEMLPAAKEILIEFLKFLEVNRKLIKTKSVAFFKNVGKFLLIVFKVTRALVIAIIDLTEAFGGLENILKSLAILFGVMFGFQMLSAIGNITLGVIGIAKAMKTLRIATLLANAALAVWPIIIGAVIVALALLIEDIVSFFQGKDSVTGMMVDEWKKAWDNLLTRVKTILSDIKQSIIAAGKDILNLPFFRILGDIKTGVGGAFTSVGEIFTGGPSAAPATSPASNTGSVNINSPINVTVPEGTPFELVTSGVQAGINDAFGNMLRQAQRETSPLVEF